VNDGVAAAGEAEVEPGLWEQLCADCLIMVDDMPVRWWPQHNPATRRVWYTDGGD
jgi:hypothetical protein